jgi:hypothetical protein
MKKKTVCLGVLTLLLVFGLVFPAGPGMADPGGVVFTPVQPMEIPMEIEIETGPASLKQAWLWKEMYQLLEDPYATVERRPASAWPCHLLTSGRWTTIS